MLNIFLSPALLASADKTGCRGLVSWTALRLRIHYNSKGCVSSLRVYLSTEGILLRLKGSYCGGIGLSSGFLSLVLRRGDTSRLGTRVYRDRQIHRGGEGTRGRGSQRQRQRQRPRQSKYKLGLESGLRGVNSGRLGGLTSSP